MEILIFLILLIFLIPIAEFLRFSWFTRKISEGISEKRLLKNLGEPDSTSENGKKAVWAYRHTDPWFNVHLEDGIVTKVEKTRAASVPSITGS